MGRLPMGTRMKVPYKAKYRCILRTLIFFNFLCSNFLTLIPLSHESICVYTRTKEYTICEYTRVLEFYDNLYLPVSVKTGSNEKEEMLTNLTKLIIDTEY